MVGMRVLIADDNATMRLMLEKLLARVGRFEVDFAGTGAEALRFYRQKHHDLMIIDNFMPVKNGIDVLRELRDDQNMERTHVIMISGEINKKLVASMRSEFLKIDDLLVKPLDFEKLGAKVSEVFARLRRRTRQDGPLLRAGEAETARVEESTSLFVDIIDRGTIVIIEIKGKLTVENRGVISKSLKDIQTSFANICVIDINSVDEIDAFGYGTLAVTSGWLVLNEKEVFLACEDGKIKERITSLGIHALIPEYRGT